jgi:DNA-binding transcriptional LysR family regulator
LGTYKHPYRLPSLDLLKGFVAVCRRLSITLAAQDLNLTQSAVSRQILALEEALGCRLLARGHRSLSLTPQGERLFREADKVLAHLQEVFDDISPQNIPVKITASIGVVSLWLLPLFGKFQQQHPDIELHITALNRILDLENEAVDLAIRYCKPAHAPAGAIKLFGETIQAVAHPTFCLGPTLTIENIKEHVLLDYDDPLRPWLGWGQWLKRQGWDDTRSLKFQRFNQYDQAISAAMAGQGIALGRLPLLRQQVCMGVLQSTPFPDNTLQNDHAYWLIENTQSPRPSTMTVANWIKDEASLPL